MNEDIYKEQIAQLRHEVREINARFERERRDIWAFLEALQRK